MMKYAPMGDPLEIRLRGYELTLRKDDAARIELVGIHDTDTGPRANAAIGTTEHPALGEGTQSPRAAKDGRARGRAAALCPRRQPKLRQDHVIQPADGLQPARRKLSRRDGRPQRWHHRNHPEASVTDLPGIYSLSPYTGEEVVSRQFMLDEHPDAIIDIIDATNIERNLYLTLQLMELDRPMVIALNMMDEVTANGGRRRRQRARGACSAFPSCPSSGRKRGHRRARRPRPARGEVPASVPVAWTFARPTVRTAVRCIAASTASATSSRTMPRRRTSRCALRRPSWSRAMRW